MAGVNRSSAQTWLSALLVVSVAAGSAFAVRYQATGSKNKDVVALSATVEMDTVPITASFPGKVTSIFVKPGDQVVAGELVASLDERTAQAAIQGDKKALDTAQNETLATQAAILPPPIVGSLPAVALPKQVYQPQPIVVTNPGPDPIVKAATAKKQAADRALQLDKTAQATASDQLASAKSDLAAATQQEQTVHSTLESAQAGLDMAKADLDKFQGLYTQGIISKAEFQKKQTDYDNANAAVTTDEKQVGSAGAVVKLKQDAVDADQKLLDAATIKAASAQRLYDSITIPDPAPQQTVQNSPSQPEPKPVMPPPLPAGGPLPKSAMPFQFAPVNVAFSPVQHQKAQSQLATAQAALSRDTQALQGASVTAGIDGLVDIVNVAPGAAVQPGTPMVMLRRPGTARIMATVTSSEASRIKLGAPCVIQIAGHPEERFSGTVESFVGAGGPTVQVKVKIQGDPAALGTLPPGTPLRVTIHAN